MASTILLFALLGLGTGALYTLAALGIVLTFRGSGVVNFASSAMGMTGGFLFFELHETLHWPIVLAIILGIALSALIGLAAHLLMTPLRQASNLTKIVVTLGLLVFLQGLVGLRYAPTDTYFVPPIFPAGSTRLFGEVISKEIVWITVVTVVLTAVVYLLYRITRFGVATSAAAESRDALMTLGWSANMIAGVNWAAGAALGGLAAILLAPVTGLSVGNSTAFLLPCLAAAVIGNFTSFPLTLAGGLGIGILQSELGRYVTLQGVGEAVPFAAIVIVVVARGRLMPLRSAINERLPRVTDGVIQWKRVIGWGIVGVVLMYVLPLPWVSAVTFTLLGAVLLESIIVITGFAGQLSLAQWAIAGCGALAYAWLRDLGVPPELAILFGMLAVIPVGVVVGSAGLRARGISLAIATLAFGVCIVSLVLSNFSINGGPNGINIGNLKLFGIILDTATEPRRFGVFVLVVLVIVGLAVANTRRGRSGRRMLAVRANERAASSLGLNVVGIKLGAFCYGAMIAALGGILTIAEYPVASFSTFDPFTSIELIDYVVVGGVGYILGPLVGAQGQSGAVGSQIISYFSTSAQQYVTLIFGVLTLLVVVQAPDGLVRFQSAIHQKNLARIRKVFRRPPRAGRQPLTIPDVSERASKVEPVLLAVEGVTVGFGSVIAVNQVSFELHSGEVLGIIGANGAGKTTLIDALTGFAPVRAGTIRVDGADLIGLTAYRRARLGLGRSFQSLELFEDLSVFENVLVACEPRDLWSWARDLLRPGKPILTPAALSAVHDLGLGRLLERLPREISYGSRRLVVIARAIAANPRVIILDEPAAGLDAQEREEIVVIIRRLAKEWGMAVLLIEHDVTLVSQVSDRMIALDVGRIIASGTPDEVRADPHVIAAYLGSDEVLPVSVSDQAEIAGL